MNVKIAPYYYIIVFYYFRLLSAIPYLVNILNVTFDASELAIVFPDEGAWKRFGHLFDKWPLITCIKVRKGTEREVTIKEGETDEYQKLKRLGFWPVKYN